MDTKLVDTKLEQQKGLPKKLEKTPILLTASELNYQTLRAGGMPARKAFEKAFKNDPSYADFFDSLSPRQQERDVSIRWAARELENRKEMKMLREKVNEKLLDLAPVALDTLEELMIESKSDKVRGDVAIEILRQNVGSPDKSDNSVEVKVVFGQEPTDIIENEEVIEGEIVDGQ